MSAALKLNSVSKQFAQAPNSKTGTSAKFQAVDDLSFDVQEGEMFALLGPNGAGKSTTIGMISGLVRLGGGRIEIFGHDNQSEFQTTRRLTGVMPQEIVIDNFFTVERSLKIHSGYYGAEDDPKWRSTLIERLALQPYLTRKPLQLSGGTKRRLMLAKALIHKPRFLILDEPTAGVDVELRHNLWGFVREINSRGTTVLLTTHYLEEAEKMCHRVAIMSKGKLVALDETHKLLNRIADSKVVARVNAHADFAAPSDWKKITGTGPGVQLEIPLKSGDTLDHIINQIKAHHLDILELQTRKADLEEVFLSLTKST